MQPIRKFWHCYSAVIDQYGLLRHVERSGESRWYVMSQMNAYLEMARALGRRTKKPILREITEYDYDEIAKRDLGRDYVAVHTD